MKFMEHKFIPFMTPEEIVDLTCFLNREQDMLEIGGGMSTVFFSNIVKSLVTIEHNREWADKLSKFEQLQNKNWTLHVVEPSWPQVHSFAPAEPRQFDKYIDFISDLENESFDVVLVDGRDRVRAAEASISKLKSSGILLIHDFWNRPKYHSILSHPDLILLEDSNSFGKVPTNTLVAFRRKH